MDANSADTGLLVVDLGNCVSAGKYYTTIMWLFEITLSLMKHAVIADVSNLGKCACIYTLPQATDCQDVLELGTPIQCLGDINQSICRIQQEQLAHIQGVNYQEIQVSICI